VEHVWCFVWLRWSAEFIAPIISL